MNPTCVNAGLVAAVFGPAPDDVDLCITVTADSITAEVVVDEVAVDGDRLRRWRRVVDEIGAAHGGTPWAFHVHGNIDQEDIVEAVHLFDGVPVVVWVGLVDMDTVDDLLPGEVTG